jgi:prepilin-type N-terminal cleavage/methylation domain-containing protein
LVRDWTERRNHAIREADSGFTLIEALTVLAIAGVLMAISVWGMHSYLVSSREKGTATQIQSTLRNTADRSLAEGRTYCVLFTSTTWSVYVHDCTVSTNLTDGPHKAGGSDQTLAAAFPVPTGMDPTEVTNCPSSGRCAYFYPRGNAIAGTVAISRRGSGKQYTVTVIGLTGRVTTA